MFVTQRIVEKRLGPYDPAHGAADATTEELDDDAQAAEARGLRFAFYGLLASLAVIALLTFPSGAPLRDPITGAIVGTTPFMDSLLFLITLIFLVCGIFYGMGAKSMSGSGDVIAGVTKTFAGLAGLVFMLLMISQFIAYFNYTNLPRVAAIEMAHLLEQANIGGLALLVGFILVIVILDFILPGVVPKWAIFAPVFIPIFIRLGVTPQTVLAAYRVGDSPVNVITPLMVYLPFIVTIAQRYRRDAGIGTVVALMIPFVIAILIAWILLFVIWFWLGIPLGPGYPITT
jgi:aminobenzoyl-glutamate transport protein